MQTINAIMTWLGVAGMLATVHPGYAGDRVKVFEMGESGQIVAFAMTAPEIAAQDAEIARRSAFRQAARHQAGKQVAVFEMGESGQTVTFPVTAGEISAQNAEVEKRAGFSAASRTRARQRVVVFEMGESGQTVAFPMTAETLDAENKRLAAICKAESGQQRRPGGLQTKPSL